MDIETPPPPPPLLTTTIPQSYYNAGTPLNDVVPHHNPQHSSSPPTSSIIIVMIIISSAIIISATIYLLIRFISRRYNRSFRTSFSPTDVVSHNPNSHEHVISLNNNLPESSLPLSLPLFTFSSLTGKIAGGDCAVCLSKFEAVDLLRLLPLCCHAFHAECIDTWLKSNLTCPLCRSNVNPSESDIMNTFSETRGNGNGSGNRSNSFRIEIGTISQRREPSNSDRRSYSVGSYDYVLDVDGYEIPIESTHRSGVSVVSAASDRVSVDKDSVSTNGEAWGETGGSGRFNRLRDYVDRFSASLRSSGRFFTGSSRRSEAVNEFDVAHGRIGEEISELFRWLSGV